MGKIFMKKKTLIGLIVLFSVCICAFGGCSFSKELFNKNLCNKKEGFYKTDNMIAERRGHSATLLQDGRVLIAGGYDNYNSKGSTAEIYDPQIDKFRVTGNMNIPRLWHTATLLNDGRVLITGGFKLRGGSFLNNAEIYDPKTEKFTVVGDISQKMSHMLAILLKSGDVMILRNSPIDIFNPKTNKFSTVIPPQTFKYADRVSPVLLNNGNVLIFNCGTNIKKTTEVMLYNPKTDAFTKVGDLIEARNLSENILLSNGKVLIIGGTGNNPRYLNSVELYDPNINKSLVTGNMLTLSGTVSAINLFSKNEVLILGGNKSTKFMVAEIYNTDTNKSRIIKTNLLKRYDYATTLLQDGSVLITGGVAGYKIIRDAVIYYPSKKDLCKK